MLIYNIHAPSKTFAVQSKEDETYDGLIDRITKKAGLEKKDATALKTGKEGALVYEFEGERWSLEDDDDLSILHSRLPPKSTPSATLHLSPPHAHAHFAPSPAPPAYSTASSAIKSKNQNRSRTASATKSNTTANGSSSATPKSPKSKDFATQTPSSNGDEAKHASKSSPQKPSESKDKSANPVAKYEREVGKTATGFAVARPKSVMSARTNRTHRSKWGDDDAEPMGDVHKRKWLEFHANNGVRTVVGKVGDVEGVRILLKSGYKGVYISRPFAIKAGLVDKKFGMGTFGYTGLKTIGNVPIKVGSKTALHSALVNEEQHFDVVLGRTWLEKMNVKVDPLDQTILTYMDNGESIACDIVVLKDADGNVITIT